MRHAETNRVLCRRHLERPGAADRRRADRLGRRARRVAGREGHERRQAVREPGGARHAADDDDARRAGEGRDRRRRRRVRIAKYIHGVGDSDSFLKKAMGGMFGMGVIARIVRGYTFISRDYDPGDEIHIAGFSRGAYTARALAGMISSVGLLNRRLRSHGQERSVPARRRGLVQVQEHVAARRRQAHRPGESMLNFVSGFFARQLDADQLIADVPIKSVAVWDTVGSMGIPRTPPTSASTCSASSTPSSATRCRTASTRGGRRAARRFSGHGVGEPRRHQAGVVRRRARRRRRRLRGTESRLSDIALEWMMKQLAEVGVRLATPLTYSRSR